jgi:predicted nucleotidyltransferase
MLERENQEIYIRWLQQATSRSVVEKDSYNHAWKVAREAARLLRERYSVNRVRAFGSLVHEETFHSGSDVDLAVEGLKPADYWEAVTSVMFLDDRVSVILIDQAACRPEIWEAVEQEGVDL